MYNEDQDEQEDQGSGFAKKLRRGGRRITLQFAGTCADCGAELAVGATARWYGRGRIYGLSCHSNEVKPEFKPNPDPQTELDFEEKERVAALDLNETDRCEDSWQPDEAKTYDCTIH